MSKWFFSICFVCTVVFLPLGAYAALTEGQISSILLVLESFGAEQTVIDEVEAALRGGSGNCVFTETLYQGITDETSLGQVSRVQNFLFVDPATGYYGPVTESAVQVFQVAQGVVSGGTPLTTGFGVVGPKTRAKLTEVCETKNAQANTSSNGSQNTTNQSNIGTDSQTNGFSGSTDTINIPGISGGSFATDTNTIPSTPVPTLSNEEYLDTLRNDIYNLGIAEGIPTGDLAEIDTALADLPLGPTSPDEESAPALSPLLSQALSATLNSLIQKLFSGIGAGAASQTVLRDFGTPRVLAVIPCSCTANVLIKMQPTGPDYPVALTYTPGTQVFASNNIPTIGQSLLGKYTPVGVCMVPAGPTCAPLPNNGNITSFVGSSVQ